MHLQQIPVLFIPRERIDNASQLASNFEICKVTPVYRKIPHYETPYKRLGVNDVWQVNNTGLDVVNTVSNASKSRASLIDGSHDVDYVYAMYIDHPSWFEGSSEEAFKNREAVFNMTYNLLSDDYYSLFLTAAKRGWRNKYAYAMLKDIFASVGLSRYPTDKARYPVSHHLGIIKDFLYDKYNHKISGGIESITDVYSESVFDEETFRDSVFGEVDNTNTAVFIKQCIKVGGIGLLISYLNAMYGSLILRKDK